jgi:hypothetical protein
LNEANGFRDGTTSLAKNKLELKVESKVVLALRNKTLICNPKLS